mgnify:CR=1 FL=1
MLYPQWRHSRCVIDGDSGLMICWMNYLLSIDGIDDLATAGAFGPHARLAGSCFIVDDRVSIRDCLAAERAGATDCLWVVWSHPHDLGSYV